MRTPTLDTPAGSAGFTLIELLVALALTAVIASQLFLVLQFQHRSYSDSERALDIQEDARLVVDLVSADVRGAGFMVPERAAIASGDGGTSGPDRLCVSDPTIIDRSRLDNASVPFARAQVSGIAPALVTILLGHLDIDNDGTNDFSSGAGIIVSDGVLSHCARITAVSSTQIDFSPALNPVGWNLAAARAAPAIVYEVDSCGLVGLTRNCQSLSVEVEDLQVEFGVDDVLTDGVIDLATEFPVHDLNATGGHDPALVRSVRLTVITRTPQDLNYTGPGHPGAANRSAGASDGSRRRTFTTTVLPRNLF